MKKTHTITKGRSAYEEALEQRRQEDAKRQIPDVDKVRMQCYDLLKDRILIGVGNINPIKYDFLRSNYPLLYKTTLEYPDDRLEEFKAVLDSLLANLAAVKDGKQTKEKCSVNFLDKDVAKRFPVKKKNV